MANTINIVHSGHGPWEQNMGNPKTRNKWKTQVKVYPDLARGCSLVIPVTMQNVKKEPIDITGFKISFTVKKVRYDFDRPDARSYIQKDFQPQNATEGKFRIQLTSRDMDFEPGDYYFDIVLKNEESGAVMRLAIFQFELVGGPTNRTVNNLGGQFQIGDEITTILTEGHPIIVIAPTVGMNQGPPGPGVPDGGTTNDVLMKNTPANQDTGWRKISKENLTQALKDELEGKVDKQQQPADAGKVLGIGADGKVLPADNAISWNDFF